MIEADRTEIEARMNFTREKYRLMRQELMKIVMWAPGNGTPASEARDRVEAAKAVVMVDVALLKAEIETGMYKKPIEALAKKIHYDPVSSELRLVIIAAWARGGLLPREAIEQMVPVMSPQIPSHSAS